MYPSKLLGCVARVSPEPHPSTLANTTLKGTVLPGYRAGHSNLSRLLGNVARVASSACIHHWLVDPSEAVCRCDGEAHYHAGCRLCLATRTFLAFLEPGPIAKAAVYAKRGAKAKWKKAEIAEDAPEGAPLQEERTVSVCISSERRRA